MSLDSVFNKPFEEFAKQLPEMEPLLQNATLSLSRFGTPVIQVPGYKGSYSVRKLENQVFEAATGAMNDGGIFKDISIESLKLRLAGHHFSQKLYSLLKSPTELQVHGEHDRYVNPIPRLYDQKMAQIRSTFFGRLFSPLYALWYHVWTGVSSMREQKKYPFKQESASYHIYGLDLRFRTFKAESINKIQNEKIGELFNDAMREHVKKAGPPLPDNPYHHLGPEILENLIQKLPPKQSA